MQRLRVLGGLYLDGGADARFVTLRRKPLALLALLAEAADRAISRDKLLAMFWPESDAEHARNALNQLLHQIRRELGADIIGGSATLELNSERLSCDLWDFRSAMAAGEFSTAERVYHGPFLDGFYLRGLAEFESWTESTRAVLAREYANALEHVAREALQRGDVQLAITISRKLVAAEPLSTRAAIALVHALERGGERAEALRFLTIHRQLVRNELGAELPPELKVFQRRLLAEAPDETSETAEPVRTVPSSTRESGEEPAPASISNPAGRRVAPRRPWRWAVSVAVGVVLALTTLTITGKLPLLLAAWRGPSAPALDVRRFVVMPFANRTGDAKLDYIGATAADWVTQSLARVESITVVHHSLELWGTPVWRPGDTGPERRNLGRETGAGTAIYGSFVRRDDSLVIMAHVVDVATGNVLQVVEPVAAPIAEPMRAVEGLGDRLTSILSARRDPMLAHWVATAGQPIRFSAYLEYSAGMRAFAAGDFSAAIDHFDRAARLDSTYTLPRLWKVFALRNRGESADSILDLLEKRHDSMARLDRAVLEFLAGTQRNDNQAAYVAAQRMVELAPGSEFLYKLALAAMDIQHPREALAAVKRLNTHQGWLATWGCCPGIVSRAEEWIGNYEAAIPAYERIAAADPHDGVNRQLEFTSLAALGRVHELDSILTLAEATSTEWDVPDAYSMRVGLRYRAAWALQAYGHTADARRIFRTLVDSTDAIALPEKSALPRHELRLIDRYYRALAMYYAGDLADAHAELGRIRAALTHREARGQSSPFGPDLEDVLGTMGCVATLQRDSVGVRRILVALRSFPDSEPEAQIEQARIMALTGNRDEMMRLVVSAVEHGARLGGHLLRLEFVPYRDYPPFRALIEPKG